METGQIVGLALVAAGLFDAVAARLVVGPRIAVPRQRLIVEGSLVASGVMMVLLGGAIYAGVIELG